MVYMTAFSHEFPGLVRAARPDQWRAKLSDAGQLLKALYKKDSPIFKDTDILHTGSKIKHDLICMSHPYYTKHQIIDMPK